MPTSLEFHRLAALGHTIGLVWRIHANANAITLESRRRDTNKNGECDSLAGKHSGAVMMNIMEVKFHGIADRVNAQDSKQPMHVSDCKAFCRNNSNGYLPSHLSKNVIHYSPLRFHELGMTALLCNVPSVLLSIATLDTSGEIMKPFTRAFKSPKAANSSAQQAAASSAPEPPKIIVVCSFFAPCVSLS